ncbi:MAG TPA: site-specific integrase [Bacteroidales bacterium]|nr:site-specific integrase [Bacteroidales bacterium]
MAKLKIVLYKSKKLKDGRHPLMVRIAHKNKTKYVATGFSAHPDEWVNDQLSNEYKKNHKLTGPEFEKVKATLRAKHDEVFDLSQGALITGKGTKVDKIINKLKKDEVILTFDQLTQKVINECKSLGRFKTAQCYDTMLCRFREFYGKIDEPDTDKRKELRNKVAIDFSSINYSFLKDFDTWHKKKGNQENSLAVYMRHARAIYNRAIMEGMVSRESYPYGRGKYQIKTKAPKKRAISKDVFKAIEDLPSEMINLGLLEARNYVLFSFYMRGMNFIDIAYLKVKNIKGDRVIYKRLKTNKELDIKILPEAQKILDNYLPGKDTEDYIFPILKGGSPEKVRADEANALKVFNKNMNRLAELVGYKDRITSYTVRHSWATIAKRIGIPLAAISDSLSHSSTDITQAYLDSIEKDELDKANELITA